ncbi:MAG: hypothetical protein A3C56_04140 [Ignavibacteria bacterium RIFCSPHIGHO2_02_FULL_56_12]|nr:MAG: hypothetical protein A3C56_04140 [Ignavibacteria bacterium RIFCSPHIGHO2_02_FULL_56_12]
MKTIIIVMTLLSPSILAQNEWALQEWIHVVGKSNGEQLGSFVNVVPYSTTLPYRAVVRGGALNLYSLQSNTDTTVRRVFFGNRMLAGDINDDGYTDVVCTKTTHDYDTVFVFYGTVTGIDTLDPPIIPAEYQYEGLKSVAIGDVNTDGKNDLILAGTNFPNPGGNGKVSVYLNPVNDTAPDFTVIGDTVRAGLGLSVAVGDLNDDGLNDMAVLGWHQTGPGPGPQRYNYVNIYYGKMGGELDAIVDLQLRSYDINSTGLAILDVNGDGNSDLAFADWNPTDSLKYVKIYFGGTSFDTIPDYRLTNPGVANFGFILGDAGDMNGDGSRDVFVSAHDATIDAGFVFVFSGGPSMDDKFDAAVGMGGLSKFGSSVASLGDVNGDGLADLLIGAPEYSFTSYKGYWGIFLGSHNIPVTGIRDISSPIPSRIKLLQNFPNPFNPVTTISFELLSASSVKLVVLDVLGQEVATLISEWKEAGIHTITFDAGQLSSGMYFYRLTTIDRNGSMQHQTKAMTLLR